MGVVSVDQAVATIMEGLEKGFFYIYTHPGRTAAIIRQEMDLRLAGYKQPPRTVQCDHGIHQAFQEPYLR